MLSTPAPNPVKMKVDGNTTRVVMEGSRVLYTNPNRIKCRNFLNTWRRLNPGAIQLGIYFKRGDDFYYEGNA